MHDFINLMGGLSAFALAVFGMLAISFILEEIEYRQIKERKRQRV
jgi:hypothetical protein